MTSDLKKVRAKMSDKYGKQDRQNFEFIVRPLEIEREKWEAENSLDFYELFIEINTADYLRYMANHALSVGFIEFCGEDTDEKLEALLGEDYKTDNTYNYDEPYSRDMVVALPKRIDEAKAFTIAFAPHYGGDVRGNYGDYIVMTFKNYWDYAEASSAYYEQHQATVEIDGKTYTITYNGGGSDFRLEREGEYITDTAYFDELTEEGIIREIKEKYL